MKRISFLSLLIGIMALMVEMSDQSAMAYSGCGGVIAPVVNADYEQQVFDLVNTTRANQSLPPLKRTTLLDQAAQYHSTDMGQDNYFQHDSYDGRGDGMVSPTWVCAWSTRTESYYGSNNLSLAENIAAGYGTPQAVMNGWLNSPGHYANIVSTSNWEIGIGYATVNGSKYYSYWAQDFGRRNGVYPLVINRDAAATNSRNVSIFIYGAWQQMRLQNDSGTWGDWQLFQSNFAWTLGSGVGNHTLNAQLQNGTTTANTSDSIYLAVDGAVYSVFLPLVVR